MGKSAESFPTHNTTQHQHDLLCSIRAPSASQELEWDAQPGRLHVQSSWISFQTYRRWWRWRWRKTKAEFRWTAVSVCQRQTAVPGEITGKIEKVSECEQYQWWEWEWEQQYVRQHRGGASHQLLTQRGQEV